MILAQAAPGGGLGQALPMLVIFVAIFYFLVFRPQQKEAKEHAALVAGLQKGDHVVTSAGIHGRIHEAKGDTLVLEISPGAQLTVDRDSVKQKRAVP
jgi:preprotein translocase subunit YajC